jgi:hypothetical protein
VRTHWCCRFNPANLGTLITRCNGYQLAVATLMFHVEQFASRNNRQNKPIVLATQNPHKLIELREIFAPMNIKLCLLSDIS